MLNEDEVVEGVCRYLEETGYEILKRCSTKEKGIDIIAKHPSKAGKFLIEAKGGTSTRLGSARFDKGFNSNQVFDRVAKCFYTAARMFAKRRENDDRVAMAFPDTAKFRDLLRDIRPAIDKLEFSIFLV